MLMIKTGQLLHRLHSCQPNFFLYPNSFLRPCESIQKKKKNQFYYYFYFNLIYIKHFNIRKNLSIFTRVLKTGGVTYERKSKVTTTLNLE